MVKVKQGVAALSFVVLLAGGGAIWQATRPGPVQQPAAGQPKNAEDEGGPPLHPLMIEASRNREYPGGDIVVEQQLGPAGGYSRAIVSYPSDGLKLRALMATPATPPPVGGYPVIILNHGYIPPETYRTAGADYAPFIAHFASRGYVVIKPDYRGHDQSEGTAESGYYSPAYTTDILNLISSVKRYPGIKADGIGMIGHSLGGMVSLRTIVVSPDVKATVMMAGAVGTAEDLIYGWQEWRQQTGRTSEWRPRPNALSMRRQIVEQYGDPRDNTGFWRQIMPINYVEYVAGPVQIHHGTGDESVPSFMSGHLQEAMQAAGKPSELFIYEGGDHNFTVHRGLYTQRVTDFFDRHLR